MSKKISSAPVAPLLQVQDLSKNFRVRQGLFTHEGQALTAIDRVSFNIEAGQIFGLVGESGSGKSTLGRLILQLIKPDSGRILFQGADLCAAGAGHVRLARQKLQIIFQDPSAALSPRRTIAQTLLEPLEQFGLGKQAERQRKCAEVLESVGMHPDVLARLPHQLSSGQRQRIGIARAVLTNPDLIVADEAVSALDVSVQARILDLIRRLQSERGIAFLFISHDLAVVQQIANVVGVMFRGQIVESGPADSLFRQPSHPYTQALLAAVPDPDPSTRPAPAPFSAGLSRLPQMQACVFADRCSKAMQICRVDEPQVLPLASNLQHRVKCHLYSESMQ